MSPRSARVAFVGCSRELQCRRDSVFFVCKRSNLEILLESPNLSEFSDPRLGPNASSCRTVNRTGRAASLADSSSLRFCCVDLEACWLVRRSYEVPSIQEARTLLSATLSRKEGSARDGLGAFRLGVEGSCRGPHDYSGVWLTHRGGLRSPPPTQTLRQCFKLAVELKFPGDAASFDFHFLHSFPVPLSEDPGRVFFPNPKFSP